MRETGEQKGACESRLPQRMAARFQGSKLVGWIIPDELTILGNEGAE